MKFIIEKGSMLIIKSKTTQKEGIEHPNQERIKILGEKETYLVAR